MTNSGKLIKAGSKSQFKTTNVVIGGCDLSDLPSKQELLNEHLEEAKKLAGEEAQEILEKAQAEASAFLEQSQKEAEALKVKAYEEGFESGKHEVIDLIKDDFREALIGAKTALERVEQERKECIEDEEARIYNVILSIAKHLFKKEFSLDEGITKEYIQACLNKLESRAEVKLYLDNSTAQALNNIKEELIAQNPGMESINIIADVNLNAGDIILESNKERLDCRLDTQLEELAKEILK